MVAAEPKSSDAMQGHSIALVGMSCRLPAAEDPEELWHLLEQGGEAPSVRSGLGDANETAIKRLKGSEDFDWRAFGVSPKEAMLMDPQQKLLLELTSEVLSDAGIRRRELAGRQVAVVIGAMWHDYMQILAQRPGGHEGYEISGSTPAFLAARISHAFDFRGPAQILDAGCASSLLAIIDACRMLVLGEVDFALAGGVNLILAPESGAMMARAGLLSQSGHCRPFDSRADGFVRAEGAALVVLKRLEDVVAEDRVYAVIRGWAVNQSGRADWIMAPTPAAQEFVIRSALARAGSGSERVDYVELNGTGFARGDAVEVGALDAALGGAERDKPCFVGSLKSNLGHLEAASGVASVIKVALALHRRMRPPTINVEIENEALHTARRVRVQRELVEWSSSAGLPLAGVSTLSYSGSNGHLVLQGVEQDPPRLKESQLFPLPISARSREALGFLVERYGKMLERMATGGSAALEDVCYTACLRRDHHPWRLSPCGRSVQDLARALRTADLPTQAGSHVAFWIPRDRLATQRFWGALLERLPRQSWFRGAEAAASIPAFIGRSADKNAALLPYALLELWRGLGVEGHPIYVEAPQLALPELEDFLAPARFADFERWRKTLNEERESAAPRFDGQSTLIALTDPASRPEERHGPRVVCPDFTDAEERTRALAALYELGCDVRWELGTCRGRCTSLPHHPWLASVPAASGARPAPPETRPIQSLPVARRQRGQTRLMANRLASATRRVLGYENAEPVSATRPLFELGFTSISLAALKGELEREFGCQLSVAKLLYCQSLQEVAELLIELGAGMKFAELVTSPAGDRR